jgi:multidrug efflux pump
VGLFKMVPLEFTPKEDRGAFILRIQGPEGASYEYMMEHVLQIEERLAPFIESGEIQRLLMRIPGSFSASGNFNDAVGIVVLSPWSQRKPVGFYIDEVKKRTADIAGVTIFPVQRGGFGGPEKKPVQFVIGGPSYEALSEWRDIIIDAARDNSGLDAIDHDYKETKPHIGLTIDYDRAASLGVSLREINGTLETLLGSKRVTTFINDGEEYYVVLESDKDLKSTPEDINAIYVRSARSGAMIPLANLVTQYEFADALKLQRYNRMRAVTIEANLVDDYSLGEALESLENTVRSKLPEGAVID